jgi:hypothetical protein
MKMAEIQLTLPGIIANKIISESEEHLQWDQQEKIRDYAASINTGPSGRFEHEVLLDTASIINLQKKSKYLTVEASFLEHGKKVFILTHSPFILTKKNRVERTTLSWLY